MEKAAQLPLGEKRNKLLAQAEKILVNQDQGVIPMFYYGCSNLIDTNIWGGWYPNILDIHLLKYIYKKK